MDESAPGPYFFSLLMLLGGRAPLLQLVRYVWIRCFLGSLGKSICRTSKRCQERQQAANGAAQRHVLVNFRSLLLVLEAV
jgi:hypothetical protein